MNKYNSIRDCEKDTINIDTYSERLLNNSIVYLKGKTTGISVGKGLGLRINTSIGISDIKLYVQEINKINQIEIMDEKPDVMMDLSTIKLEKPLYQTIIEKIGCPVGTIPYYVCFDKTHGIDKDKLLSELRYQAESGISFWTLHFTADLKNAKLIHNRNTSVISRGGGLLLRDMQLNKRQKNIIYECLNEIVHLCLKYDICISVGTTFRAANIMDGFDEIQKAEMIEQNNIIEYLISCGVHVIQEGVGHIRAEYIAEYTSMLRKKRYIPFMPLGPIISDRTKGKDHINNAIGAYIISSLNGADIINTVTREEHTGGIPSKESVIEAIETAKMVATIIDDQRFYNYFNFSNGKSKNCMNNEEFVGCNRCGDECPFLWDFSK